MNALLISIGFIVVTWVFVVGLSFLQGRRIDRLQQRLEALEKKQA